jgi:plasmid stability protein
MTTQEIDNLNYDQARDAVRAAGHKGTWIASAKSDILKKVLKGEMTPTDAAVATISGSAPTTIAYAPTPAPAPASPVSLDGVFGAAIQNAVGSQIGAIQQRLDDIASQIGSVPHGVDDKLADITRRLSEAEGAAAEMFNDLITKVDAALQQGGSATARVIAPVLGLPTTGTTDPVTRALEFYCAPGAALKPVLVKGGPGAGKTYGARQHGSQFDRYIEIGITPATEACDLLGYPTPTTPWIDGPLTEAFRLAAAGKTVCLTIDEYFRARGGASQVMLTVLTPFADNGDYYYRLRTGKAVVDPVTQCEASEEIVAPRRNLAIIATTNVGGKFDISSPDPAVKERFVPVHVEVEETKLRRVIDAHVTSKSFYNSVTDRVVEFWKACKVLVADSFLEQLPSTRILSEAVSFSLNEDDVPHRILDMGLHIWVAETLDGLPEPEQCKRVVDALKAAFPGYAPAPTGDPTIDKLILV